jgi:hypothetical protein
MANHSTTHWDKQLKKRIKDSDYICKLDRTKGLIEGVKRSVTVKNLRGIKEYGKAMLFDRILTDMRSCLEDAIANVSSLMRSRALLPLLSRWTR